MGVTASAQLPTHPTLRDPRNGEPLRAVGVVRGRPVWPVMGGSGEGTGGQAPAGQASGGDAGAAGSGSSSAPASGGAVGATTGQSTTGQAGQGQAAGAPSLPEGWTGEFNPERAKSTIDALREELRQAKARASTAPAAAAPPALDAQAALAALAQALGATGTQDGRPSGNAGAQTQQGQAQQSQAQPDVATQATTDAANAAARQAQVALAAYKAAPTAGANPDGLTDSVAFREATADLDPTAADFQAKLTAAITKALEANPTLRSTGQVPDASGAVLTGRPGEVPQSRAPKSLSDAVNAHYGT